MDIENTIHELKAAELAAIIDALNAKGCHYEWESLEDHLNGTDDEDDEDTAKPWVSMYINDGIWHDVEVFSIELLKDSRTPHFKIVGLDYAGGGGGLIERVVWPGELPIGAFHDIASRIN